MKIPPELRTKNWELKATSQVEEFNKKYPIGTKVIIRKDFDNEATITETRSEAMVSSSGHAVIFLEEISGYYLLDGVTPIKV